MLKSSSDYTPINIGYLPLLDSAPFIIAQEAGFFTDQGLQVTFSRENNWASIRDKLSLGMIDAAHLLAPMIMASRIQAPNDDPNKAFKTALALGYNGNAITLSNALYEALGKLENGLQPALQNLKSLVESTDKKLIIGTVHPHSIHTSLIHILLKRAKISTSKVEIKVIPPVRMVTAIQKQEVDLFCVGEPWNTAAQIAQAGKILCYANELWAYAPEKVLGVNAGFAAQQPELHKKIIKAVITACQWLQEADHLAQAAVWLSNEKYVNCSSDLLIQAMMNQWFTQSRQQQKRKIFFSDHATAPWPAHAAWIEQSMRLQLGHTQSIPLLNIDDAYDWDTYSTVLTELNLPLPSTQTPPGELPNLDQ